MSENISIFKALPNTVVDAVVSLVKDVLYPITATTVGVGRLIEQKFNTLNEVQKIIAEQTLKEAAEKIHKSGKTPDFEAAVKPQVIYEVLNNTDAQSDDAMRHLWGNLAAREFSEGSVHPEIARLLGRLVQVDILLLSQIHEKQQKSGMLKLVLKGLGSTYTLGIMNEKKTFNHKYLQELGLLEELSGQWLCNVKGREILRSIGELD